LKLEKIVVGYVDSDEGRDALALAGELAAAWGGEILVASVLEYAPIPIDTSGYDRALEEHFEQLFAGAERALGARFAERRLTHPSPAHALNDLAEAENAAAIVLGSTHRGPLGRIYPGSVSERLLDGGPCAVIVAPRGFAGRDGRGLDLIGVGFDGRRESWVALERAAAMAKGERRLRVITAVPPMHMTLPIKTGVDEARAARRRDYAEVLERAAASLDGAVSHQERLLDGEPSEVLAAESADLDLLVVGSRGYGPVQRVFLGGVSEALTRGARSPLMIVPRGAAAGR
jgi:nucleotide-binding universal stress UspA family protein